MSTLENSSTSTSRSWHHYLTPLRDLFSRNKYIQLPQPNRSYPLAHSARSKHRRWPLVLRFHKGAIHAEILLPVALHAAIAAGVVGISKHTEVKVGMPDAVIPCLSIVVGLMLVFRNTTAYTRFSNGRDQLNNVTTSVRCLSRAFLACVPPSDSGHSTLNPTERVKIVETIKILIACMYTIKNHLHTHWGRALSPGTAMDNEDGQVAESEEYKLLLPQKLKGYENRGLGLTLELVVFIERFIKFGADRRWFHNATASGMIAQLNNLVHAYGTMEVIRLVPMPVAHLIHSKQTLALFCTLLPFAVVVEMGWLAVVLAAVVSFTLYGIEGIASKFEDPFAGKKLNINLDEIVEDARKEVETLLIVWEKGGTLFEPRAYVSSRSSRHSDDSWDTAYNTILGSSRRNTQASTPFSTAPVTGTHTGTNTSPSKSGINHSSRKSTSPTSPTQRNYSRFSSIGSSKAVKSPPSKPPSPAHTHRDFSHTSTVSSTSVPIDVSASEAIAKSKIMKEYRKERRSADREQGIMSGEDTSTYTTPDMNGAVDGEWGNFVSSPGADVVYRDRPVDASVARTSGVGGVGVSSDSTGGVRAGAGKVRAVSTHTGVQQPRNASAASTLAPPATDHILHPDDIDSSVSTGEVPAGVDIPGRLVVPANSAGILGDAIANLRPFGWKSPQGSSAEEEL